jgi:hypothetical protein
MKRLPTGHLARQAARTPVVVPASTMPDNTRPGREVPGCHWRRHRRKPARSRIGKANYSAFPGFRLGIILIDYRGTVPVFSVAWQKAS